VSVEKLKVPVVAIWMITYNHQDYISQAVESVINQKTNFLFKIFLSEDCSEDNTREICLELQKKYPKQIDLFLPNTNLGVKSKHGIGIRTYQRCFSSGAKYVALLEGDDYWTDLYKLQKQVDFLENNQDFQATFHKRIVVDKNGVFIKDSYSPAFSEFSKEELIIGTAEMYTNTILFRNNIKLLDDFYMVPNGDTVLWHILGFKGKAKFLSEVLHSAYRIHSGGIWSTVDEYNRFKFALITYGVMFSNLENVKMLKEYSEMQSVVRKMANSSLVTFLTKLQFLNYFKTWYLLGTFEHLSFNELCRYHFKCLVRKLSKKFT
jgi:glycosyltransferase involved in cell wall biosynthesis